MSTPRKFGIAIDEDADTEGANFALSAPFVPRLRASRGASAFLDGVNVASLALMAVVTARLIPAAIVDVPTALLATGGGILLLRFRVSSTWVVLGAAVAGVIIGA